MNILPAIIPEDIEDLESGLLMVRGLTRTVQIDICDGRLTPKASWPYKNNRGEFEEILGQERGLPLWEDFDFEIDLMVEHPETEYEKWIDAGASRIIFHFQEKKKDVLKEIFQKTKERGVETGIALHLQDDISTVEEFKDDVSIIQLMGIQDIGFQGEPFDKGVLEKIKQVKIAHPHIPVSVDGGVNEDTAPLLKDAGADSLVVGSAIFKSFDIRETISYFESL